MSVANEDVLNEEVIKLDIGSVSEAWWEQAVKDELKKNPVPWMDESSEPIVPVKENDGKITLSITKEMLEDYSKDAPGGRNLWSSFLRMEEVAPLAIAGVRHMHNISNVHDTRQVKNSFERLLTSISLGLMIKILYNKGKGFPYQITYGHEVRYHSGVYQDITTRTLAALGFVCHVLPGDVPTAIWNTSTMGKFFNFVLSFCGTASHAESEIDGLKIMDYEGSQFLIESIEAMVAIQRAILEKVKRDGKVELVLSSKTDSRISDQLYKAVNDGMVVYKDYQDKTAADDFTLGLIRSIDPSKVYIDCAHGAGYRTLKLFFKEMGLSDVAEKINWMHTEERADFGNIGKLKTNLKTNKPEIFDLGADAMQVYEKVSPSGKPIKFFPVLNTADYPEQFKKMPMGSIILHTDMDNDRLLASQVLPNDTETRTVLEKTGVVYNVIDDERILPVFISNKFFHFLHEMNFARLKKLFAEGKLEKDRTMVVLKTLASTPAVDKWAEKRAEEGYNIVVINTAVGYAKLANVMYRIEGEMKRNPGKDITISDASGKDINVGHNPILLAAWEESGGINIGITYGFKDLLGNTFLSEREKSATESIFLSLALISSLQKDRVGEGTDYVDLAHYLEEIYERDEIDTPIDFRFDNKLFVPGTSAESVEEEKQGNLRKNRIFGAYLAIVVAYMRKEVTLDDCKKVLRDIFDEEYSARKEQGMFKDVLLNRFKDVDVDSIVDILFTGDGVIFVFEKEFKSETGASTEKRKWFVLFRPSGTEPKLKAYGFGLDPERTTIDAWTFGFTENMAGQLPDSFMSNKHLIDIWGSDGLKAIDKARRMQNAWEVWGKVIDPEDLNDAEMAELEKTKLHRTFSPPDNHLELVQDWVKEKGLGTLSIDTSAEQAMSSEQIVELLECIPDEVYKKLGRTKAEVIAKEK